MDEDSTAFASQEETRQAILSVLKLRQNFLHSKGIDDMAHVLTNDERGELVKSARFSYETSEEQLHLQTRDQENGLAKGKTLSAKAKAKGRGIGAGKAAGKALLSLPVKKVSSSSSASRSANAGADICNASTARSGSGRCWPSPAASM